MKIRYEEHGICYSKKDNQLIGYPILRNGEIDEEFFFVEEAPRTYEKTHKLMANILGITDEELFRQDIQYYGEYCNKCGRFVEDLNENEESELILEDSFVCSTCINEEMEKDEFEVLYNLYLGNFSEENGEPVCYNEFVDNEIPYYKEKYADYLRDTVLEDENFDVKETEDFWTWVETELMLKYDGEGNLI